MRSQDEWALAPIGTATSVARRNGPSTRNRNVGRIAGTSIMAIMATTLAPWAATTAYAAVPLAPANIVIFPNRDFVGLEGYENRAGDPVTVTVTRGATVTGSARGTFNSAGDMEINHPGGVCWGTNPAVVAAATPNIQAGDVVTAHFDDGTSDSATTQSPVVTSASKPALFPNKVVVLGTLSAVGGPVANTAQMEQRIVEPLLLGTEVRKRDVRSPNANAALTSNIAFAGDTFTATYTFASSTTADIALAGGMRVMTWQAEDAAANRQGLTIAEFGETGGPGMGECPSATPGAVAPSAPAMGTASVGDKSAYVRWNRPIQGSSVITGYSIQVLNAAGAQEGLLRAAPETATASNARIFRVTGLTPGRAYNFQVRATNAAGPGAFSNPSNTMRPATTPGAPIIRAAAYGTAGGALTATATWLPPVSNGGDAINGYVVTALRINPGGPILRRISSVPLYPHVRSLSMTLPAGTYRFVVQARNRWGLGVATSASSNMVAAR